MKKALVLSLVVAILGFAGLARTDFVDSLYIEGAFTLSGTSATSFVGTTFGVDMSSTVSIDGATSARLISAGFTSLESPANRFGVSSTVYVQVATTATTGVTAVTHTGTGPTMGWTVPAWTNTNSTSYTTHTPSWVLGYDAGAAMTIAVTDTTGAVDISHAGSGTNLTWAANAMTLTTTFEVVGASTFDGVVTSGIVSVDDTTDASSTVTGSIHTDGGLGVAMKAFIGTDLDVDGTANLDNTDIDGTLAVDGTTAALTCSTSVISYTPIFTIGYDVGAAMTFTTTDTTGAVAITHAGSGPAVTWTADSFALVGPLDVGGFFDMGTMDVGIAVTTASPFAMEVHTEPLTTLTAGDTGLSAGIRSRYHVSVAQPNQISISAVEARLRVKHGLADGGHSAVSGVIEASGTDADFTGTATTQRSGGFFALDFDSDVTLANDGWLTGVTINSSVDGAVSMANTQFAGLRISTNAGKEVWEQGIVIDDNAATIGLDIGICATDIQLGYDATIVNTADTLTLTETYIDFAGDVRINSDYQPITQYIAFDIEEATMDGDDGTGIKVASVDVNATGLILSAFVNVTQGYSEASDTIELIINDTDNVTSPTTTLVGATDTSSPHLLAYQPATGATVLGATSTTNRYVVVCYKDVGDDGSTGANLQGVLIVTYMKQ